MESKKPKTTKAKETKDKKSKSPIKTGTDRTKIPIRGKTENGKKQAPSKKTVKAKTKSSAKKSKGTTKPAAKKSSTTVKSATASASMKAPKKSGTSSKPGKKALKGVSDIRRSFHKNEEPLYFISATNFNLLGADEWIKGFKFITYIECFDGLHPNVFSPKEEIPHDDFEGIEDINNYLLQHPEVQDYLKTRSIDGSPGKAMFLMFNEETERLA